MIPDFPHNTYNIYFTKIHIRIRLAQLIFLLPPDVAKSLPCRLSQISFGPIIFLYYEESLVSSNLNSKQLRFHGVRPNVHAPETELQPLGWSQGSQVCPGTLKSFRLPPPVKLIPDLVTEIYLQHGSGIKWQISNLVIYFNFSNKILWSFF